MRTHVIWNRGSIGPLLVHCKRREAYCCGQSRQTNGRVVPLPPRALLPFVTGAPLVPRSLIFLACERGHARCIHATYTRADARARASPRWIFWKFLERREFFNGSTTGQVSGPISISGNTSGNVGARGRRTKGSNVLFFFAEDAARASALAK